MLEIYPCQGICSRLFGTRPTSRDVFIADQSIVEVLLQNFWTGTFGGELYESVGVEAPILLSYTHKIL